MYMRVHVCAMDMFLEYVSNVRDRVCVMCG